MGMKITNIHEVKTMFHLMDKEVPKRARKLFKVYTLMIEETARKFAPVDKYRLEQAIHALPFKETPTYIKSHIVVNGRIRGRNVSTYATIVHEYPWSKRGPKTRAKGPRAGPRYLTRAIEEHRKEMIRDLHKAMQDGLTAAVRRSGVNATKRGKRR